MRYVDNCDKQIVYGYIYNEEVYCFLYGMDFEDY